MYIIFILCLFGQACIFQVYSIPVHIGMKHLKSAAKFWHISDLHLDPTYHVTEDHTKVCFSSKGVPAQDPGVFGDFLCDSPYQLILSAFSYMKQADLQPDVIANMTLTIQQFFPQLPVYPALGNHDYWPQDQLPTSPNAIYEAAAKLWSPWLNPEAVATVQKGGFYSMLVKPGLRLVSLNTNLYYSPNEVTVNMSDPVGQFQWLQEALELSRQNKEKVFVIAHVPIGYLPFAMNTTAIRESYNEQLVKIFRNYSDVVQGKPVNSIFVTPAVTPIKSLSEPFSNNPSLRAYLYQPDTFALLDILQFYLNLTEANLERRSEWKLEYIMTEAFSIADLQPNSLHQLALRLEQSQSKDFDKYFNHFMVSYNSSITCEGLCKIVQRPHTLSRDPSLGFCLLRLSAEEVMSLEPEFEEAHISIRDALKGLM
ncbi:hypothetical protein DNTS_034222 [Danionella cerebrum]|uniref:Uncharacterized protein n=1 Tax=Danionella cerebrum TaxID=2873325 RepID=A0A553QIY6_9TELE|nr:hypothetical protein DNTS_034222 [Danionella translucida]